MFLIEVLSENTPKEMLAYYSSVGISYIFAGENSIDVKTALNKLYSIFGIKKLLLEAGSILNGAFLRANAVDELSLVTAPIIADKNDEPLFIEPDMCEFRLKSVKLMQDNSVWLRFEK